MAGGLSPVPKAATLTTSTTSKAALPKIAPGAVAARFVPVQEPPANIQLLARNINGCKDTAEGMNAKIALVKSFIEAEGPDRQSLFSVLCWLHLLQGGDAGENETNPCPPAAIHLSHNELIDVIEWQRPPDSAAAGSNVDATHPGLYVASALEPCAPEDMKAVVVMYVLNNSNVDVIDLLRYIDHRGFIKVNPIALISPSVTDWKRPIVPGKEPPNWKKVWGDGALQGATTFVNIRDQTGRRAKLAFLGTATVTNPVLKSPKQLIVDSWKEKPPTMCIICDAGSTHPRHTDTENMMCNLPQFFEWVGGISSMGAKSGQSAQGSKNSSRDISPLRPRPMVPDAVPEQMDPAGGAAHSVRASAELDADYFETPPERRKLSGKEAWAILRASVRKKSRGYAQLQKLLSNPAEWLKHLKQINTDATLGDGSINNLIFMKLKEAFAALLDAVKLADAWLVIDRTSGQHSPMAELLIEMVLEHAGAHRPTIIAIDSLERLGNARDRCQREGRSQQTRCWSMIHQLASIYHDKNTKQHPNGTEKDMLIDWYYSVDEFDDPEEYNAFTKSFDAKLPFPVHPEDRSKLHRNKCDPSRKWSYHYMDGIFSSATHYIIKCNDADEFNAEELARTGYLYAHGDASTFKRLRTNIQQGKPTVMLHNSGGVVTAFSWLQRVMAFSRPPPSLDKLRAPLQFLMANLSKGSWTDDFGVPDVIMMKVLADRAPQLFRKHVISVDILTDSEERALEVIHGCFATSGGVPELGMGNAEVNVVYTAWSLHLTLCENAKGLAKKSIIAQLTTQALALLTAVIAITASSISVGNNPNGLVLQRYMNLTSDQAHTLTGGARYAVVLLPVLVGLISLVATRRQWRDKWSICIMAASQLTFEIYKFRMNALEYDMASRTQLAADGEELGSKQRSRLARTKFVDRVQAFYTACITEMSQGSAVKRKRPKVAKEKQQEYRAEQESMPTLAQWLKIKVHIENHYYQAVWALPTTNFITWNSGLRPYIQQRTVRDELRTVVEGLVMSNKLKLVVGKPLNEKQNKLIRQSLAAKLGLAKTILEAQKDEVLRLQDEVVGHVRRELIEDEKEKERRAEAAAEAAVEVSGKARGKAAGAGKQGSPKRPASKAPLVSPAGASASILEHTNEAEAMRTMMMELQGVPYGQLAVKAQREQKLENEMAGAEDDYLAGSLSIESYVIFRVRPLMEHLEKLSVTLSRRLQKLEAISFFVNAGGTILATAFVNFQEWVSLTVMFVMMITAAIEFTQLKSQVVSANLSVGELQNLILWWDALPTVRRTERAVKDRLVLVTEKAFLQVVDSATTAASNTQKSVEQQLDSDEAAELAAET